MKSGILTFYIGSYTEYLLPDFGGTGRGIYTVQMNTETGELKPVHTKYMRNPSYLAMSEDNNVLYCNTEVDWNDKPKLKAYKINKDCSLEFLNEQPISGGYPCHLVVHDSQIIVACYATGNVTQYPLDPYGKILECEKNYQHIGSSIIKTRQEAPHAHQVAVQPITKDIYVCDLGIDTLKAYHFREGQFLPNEEKDCTVSKGGGPRHMVFSKEGNLAYVLNELSGEVSVIRNQKDGFKELNTYSALPDDYNGTPSGSAIRLHPNGKFLYAANRQLEAIAIFGIVDESLKLISHQYTDGEEIREFNITPDGKWLIACHQNSHDTVVYNIEEDGKLTEVHRTQKILSPVCIVFPN